MDLEQDLQPELHRAGVSRTDDRIAGCDIGRGAAAAERIGARGVAASGVAVHRAERVGDDGSIEDVEKLNPELSSEPLRKLEVLEYGEVHVLEARVAEDVPAHISEGSSPIRGQDRVAGYEAASRSKFTEGGRASGSDSGSGKGSVSGRAFGPLVWNCGRGAVRDAALAALGDAC